jgi:hypothetical protein
LCKRVLKEHVKQAEKGNGIKGTRRGKVEQNTDNKARTILRKPSLPYTLPVPNYLGLKRDKQLGSC